MQEVEQEGFRVPVRDNAFAREETERGLLICQPMARMEVMKAGERRAGGSLERSCGDERAADQVGVVRVFLPPTEE